MSVPRVRRKAPLTPAEPYGPSHESGRDAHRSVPFRRVHHPPSGCAVPLLSARRHGEYAERKAGRRVPKVAASRPFASRFKAAKGLFRVPPAADQTPAATAKGERLRRHAGAKPEGFAAAPGRSRLAREPDTSGLPSTAATAPALSQPPSKSAGSHAAIAVTESGEKLVHRMPINPQSAREFSTGLCKQTGRRIVACAIGQRVD